MTLNWREEIVRTGKAEIEAKRLVYEILADILRFAILWKHGHPRCLKPYGLGSDDLRARSHAHHHKTDIQEIYAVSQYG